MGGLERAFSYRKKALRRLVLGARPEGARGRAIERENRSKSADGFSGASKAAKKARAKKATQQLGKAEANTLMKQGFTRLASQKDFEIKGKDIISVIIGANAFAILRHDDSLYVTDAACPPYKFPLVDATITVEGGVPVVEDTLTGSKFDLTSGKNIVWCPSGGLNPIKGIFNAMKQSEDPENLSIYPVKLTEDGEIWGKVPV